MSLSAIGAAQNAIKDQNSGNFLDSLTNKFLDSLTNKYILKPKDAKGIGGFVFDYEGHTQAELRAEITEHFTENNTSINDHIALKPIKITLKGYVGELVQAAPTGLTGILGAINNKLDVVDAYLGHYTPGMVQKLRAATTQIQNVATKINNAVSRVKNVVGFFTNASPAPTKQELAYQQLSNMFAEKLIFSVVTPFNFFDNMVIEGLSFMQDEDTKSWSEITVTVKQVRFATLEYTQFDPNDFHGRAMAQAQDQVDKGSQDTKTQAPLEGIAHKAEGPIGDYITNMFSPAK